MTKTNRISQLRKNKKESQATLAKIIHVSPSTIAMWETGKRAIKDKELLELSDHFGVSIDYILGQYVDLGNVPSAAHMEENLSKEQLKAIDEFIEFQKAKYKKENENS